MYSINEPDNYAVEEALQIVARSGGNVTVATVGGEDDEEILRREMAMGANQGVLIFRRGFRWSDGKGIATILKAFVQKKNFDLILTGVQAEDGGAQVGGMLAAMLGLSIRFAGELDRSARRQEAQDQPRDRRRQQGDE